MSQAALEYPKITQAQQQMWALGDFSVVAACIVPASEALVEAADPHAGQRVLDVACGSGNTAIVAARRYCQVTGIDYVPALLERAARRAQAEGVQLELCAGDAQALPFSDGGFDVVLSSFGVMFAPDQERAAAELARVCRLGGTIGLASWTPEGEVGRFFRIVSGYAPPPPGLPSPLRWGTESGVRELLGSRAQSLRTARRSVKEHFLSAEHALETFRVYFGPVRSAFELLDDTRRRALAGDLLAFFRDTNTARDGTIVVPLEYLEVVATR